MRFPLGSLALISLTGSFALAIIPACKQSSSGSASGSNSPAVTTSSSTGSATSVGKTSATTSSGTGTLAGASAASAATVEIELQPMDGAPPSSVVGAEVTVIGRPDIAAVTDANGVASLAAPPGTVQIIATSADGMGLATAAASYGVKIDNVDVYPDKVNDLGKQTLKKTGSLSGNVTFFHNPNGLDLTDSEVFVPGTTFLATTDSKGHFALAGLPAGTYEVRAQHTGFAVLDLPTVTVTEGQGTDLGNLELSLSLGPEGGIGIAPDQTVTIDGTDWQVVTNASRTVSVNLVYDSDAALMKISDEPTFLNQEWTPVAPTFSWTNFTTDGQKTLYVMYSDLNGLASSPYSVSFIIDTLPPVLTKLEILNGWAQTAVRTNFINVTADDAGTGIAEIYLSESPTDMGDPLPFDPLPNVTLSSGAGPKRVYAMVKDYVGRVSNVVYDDIVLGDNTLIAVTTYAGDLELPTAQGPYLLDGQDTYVQGDLIVDAGTTLELGDNTNLHVYGKVVMDGTSAPITIKRENTISDCADSTTNRPQLSFNEGLPGSTTDTSIINVTFDQIAGIMLGGGTLTGNTFTSADCSSGVFGNISKAGLDVLDMSGNHFRNWNVAMETTDGDSVTRFHDNNDPNNSVVTAIRQRAPAANTNFRNNLFTGIFRYKDGLIEPLSDAAIDLTGTVFSGDGTVVAIPGDQSTANAVATGLNVTGCRTIAFVGANSLATSFTPSLTITKSTFSGCDTAIDDSIDNNTYDASFGPQPITFQYNTITVNEAFVTSLQREASGMLGPVVSPTIFLQYNNMACAMTQTCDLYLQVFANGVGGGVQLSMDHNNITCSSTAPLGCRGFAFSVPNGYSGRLSFPGVSLAVDDNYWTGKPLLSPGLSTLDVLGTSFSDTVVKAYVSDTSLDTVSTVPDAPRVLSAPVNAGPSAAP